MELLENSITSRNLDTPQVQSNIKTLLDSLLLVVSLKALCTSLGDSKISQFSPVKLFVPVT